MRHDFCYAHSRFHTVPQRFPVGADGFHYPYYDYHYVRRIATD